MFGTVAETRTKRTSEPRAFMRLMTTSRVLPRDSLRIWTLGIAISRLGRGDGDVLRQPEINGFERGSGRDLSCDAEWALNREQEIMGKGQK
jgi:hypothetical protein